MNVYRPVSFVVAGMLSCSVGYATTVVVNYLCPELAQMPQAQLRQDTWDLGQQYIHSGGLKRFVIGLRESRYVDEIVLRKPQILPDTVKGPVEGFGLASASSH